MQITNQQSYWQAVDENWKNLLNICFHFNHLNPACAAYETPGDSNSPSTGRNLIAELEFLKQTKNPKLASYFNTVWCAASDNYAWSVPAWGIFCDLCSETWVFENFEEPVQ